MQYDQIIDRIQSVFGPIKRGKYIYTVMPRITEDGKFLANALYRADAWDAAHARTIPWVYLRDL